MKVPSGPFHNQGAKMKKKFDVTKHILVPKHIKLSEKEKKQLLAQYSITIKELPRISRKDPAISHLGVKEGDIIKIIRESPTAGEIVFYRGVTNA